MHPRSDAPPRPPEARTLTAPAPIHELFLTASEMGLTSISFRTPTAPHPEVGGDGGTAREILRLASRQLAEYLAGTRRSFSIPLAPEGTPFQRLTWSALQEIPYGTTISYRELAERLGHPKAVRAVAAANGRNPLPIVVPCHRVVGSDGRLTGYAGGLEIKRALLKLEGADPGGKTMLPLFDEIV